MKRRISLMVVAAVAAGACGGGPEQAVEHSAPAEALAPRVGPERTKLPDPKEAPDWAPPMVDTWRMDNGIEVWHLHETSAPLISLEMVFPNGAASDPADKAGLTALMADMLDEGAGALDALPLQESLQRLATDYGTSAATDGLEASMSMLADKLDESLALFADILRRPKMPADEFERRKAQHIAQALANEANPFNAASVVMRRALYGEGYGGLPSGGVRGTLERITHEDVLAHYKAIVQPRGATIVVVGAVERAPLEAALKKHLGDWQGEPTARKATPVAEPVVRGVYFIDFPGSTQSSVVVARRTAGTKQAEYFPARMFNWALGGAFTSRLNLNLREEKGYTYGARSTFYRWQDAGVYALMAQVKAETTRASLDEMFKELRGMAGERPLTQQELDEAKGGTLLGFPGRFEHISGVASQYASLKLDGYPADWLTKYPDNIEAVTLEQANAAARGAAAPDTFLVVIAGDRAKLEPTLAELGLPVFVYDAQGNALAGTKAAK